MGQSPAVYAHVATDPERPGKLALQYWLFYVFNDWNNLHEGDWEMIQLVFDASDAGRGAGAPDRSRWATASTRARSGRRGATTSSSGSTARTRSCTRRPGRRRTSTASRSISAARPSRASGATTRAGPTFDIRPAVQTIPSDPAAGADGLPLDRLRGPLGRAPAGVLQRTDRAEPQETVDGADPLVGRLARRQLHRPCRKRVRNRGDRLLLRRRRRGLERTGAARRPTARGWPRARRAARCSSSSLISRTTWRPSRPAPPRTAPGVGPDPCRLRAHVPPTGTALRRHRRPAGADLAARDGSSRRSSSTRPASSAFRQVVRATGFSLSSSSRSAQP